MITPDQDYNKETKCTYKEEIYSVRDNGAVLRHSRKGKKMRKDDDVWTFGKQNHKNGYMYIGQARIHQIVATAFHGEPKDKNFVVDHKDSNKCNNRPENLHWVTRLENALNNPTTRWKIEMRCGSIEAFLENPSILNDYIGEDPNFEWMRTVSKEEGKRTLKNMENWAKRRLIPSGKGILGEWIFNANPDESVEFKWQFSKMLQQPTQNNEINAVEIDEPDIKPSLTQNALQKDWKTSTKFPCCPTKSNSKLEDYVSNLYVDVIFSQNQNVDTKIVEFAITNNTIFVLTKAVQETVKPWFLCRITKDDKFLHTNLGSFFTEEGARKQFTLNQGLEWTGGDSFDDYCD